MGISRRYQVKFNLPLSGKTVYGIAQNYGEAAESAIFKDTVIVADITGKLWEVPNGIITDIPMGNPRDGDEYEEYVERQYKAARAINRSLPDDELRVGHMFNVTVADGYAFYVVTKVFKTNCDVEWRGFAPDRYCDRHFGMGGRFRKDEVLRYVKAGRTLAKIFGEDV